MKVVFILILVQLFSLQASAETRRCPICSAPNISRADLQRIDPSESANRSQQTVAGSDFEVSAREVRTHRDDQLVAGTPDPNQSFDKARERAFDHAGLANPSEVRFSRADPNTGTITEFSGPRGASVGYDAPHPNTPGVFHDQNHVSWQSGGKLRDGGRQRGNEPYGGENHPSRLGTDNDLDLIDE